MLFNYFIEQTRNVVGSIYGRGLYEVMRYWDEDHPEWDVPLRAFAEAWRRMPKWVVSRSLKAVGPNATLVGDDCEAVIRGLKADLGGEIEVGGPKLAASLTKLGLIDEYQLFLHPVVLGRGNPYFANAQLFAQQRSRVQLVQTQRVSFLPDLSRSRWSVTEVERTLLNTATRAWLPVARMSASSAY